MSIIDIDFYKNSNNGYGCNINIKNIFFKKKI